MSARLLHPDEYELDARSSVDSQGSFNLDDADFESQIPPQPRRLLHRVPLLSRLFSSTYAGYRRIKPSRPLISSAPRSSCSRLLRRLCFYHNLIMGVMVALMVASAILSPSYSNPPPQYATLRDAVDQSTDPGRGNARNEKIFIAASLYDKSGDLAGGEWGSRVLQLVDLLGPENVFLSIYENDSGEEGRSALRSLEEQVRCKKSIVFEEHLDLTTLPTVTIPGGETRIKRIEYLAEVRNRALKPLDEAQDHYDRLLYLNDVVFDPVDALQLLFSTNAADNDGIAQYRAACAVDFVNAFKFYDTYATRDLQGYSMGLPFFPWFSTAGNGHSRSDVLSGRDAVRVRSCWGGMVAFDAQYFQKRNPAGGTQPLPPPPPPTRFRATHDLFWEASECCLVHADLQDAPTSSVDDLTDTGIYMNPYVRVAYDTSTLSWLSTTRRFEKLYPFLHNVLNHLVGLPWDNPRREEIPGQRVQDTVWVPDNLNKGGGSFQVVDRLAGNDGFCGRRGLQVIVEHREEGQKGWENIPVPE